MAGREVRPRDEGGPPSDFEVLSSHDDAGAPRRVPRPVLVMGLMVIALVAAVNVGDRLRDPGPDPAWPTSCGVDHHPDWCGRPSQAMTGPDMAALARGHCPALSELEPGEVTPQPLAPIGPPDTDALALTSGTSTAGSEQALLGQPGRFAWVTRYLGDGRDGQVWVSCLHEPGEVPGLRLERDQFRSTVAAMTGDQPRIDFSKVARDIVSGAPPMRQSGVSFGFLTCDTSHLDLSRLQVGRTFLCSVEVYGWHGLGAFHTTYRVTDDCPHFARRGEPPSPSPGAGVSARPT